MDTFCQRLHRLTIWLVVAVLLPNAVIGDDVTHIVLLQSADSELYRQFGAAFRERLQPNSELRITTLNMADESFSRFTFDATTDLLVTVGTHAAQFASTSVPQLRVLNTLIPGSSFNTLTEAGVDCSRQSALFIDQPVLRQALLARLLFPQARRYGVLLGPTSKQRHAEITASAARLGSEFDIETVEHDPASDPDARRLMRNSDLLLAISDPLVLNRENAKWLLYSAYQQQVPVIGFSQAYVSAGAAAAVYSAPEQMARQSAEMVVSWLNSDRRCLSAPQFPHYFRVAVNHSVCVSLGGTDCKSDTLATTIIEREAQP